MPIELSILRQIPLFTGLADEDLEHIKAATRVRRFRQGEIIAAQGTPDVPLGIVRSGVVKLFATSPEGREQVLRLVAAGQTFHAVAALDGQPGLVSAAALEPSVVYLIPGAYVRQLVALHPEVAQAAVRLLAGATRQLVALAENLSLHHVTQRVARLLLEQEQCTCERCRAHRLTQQEMAAVVGTAREVVGRALRDLQDIGAVRTQRGSVVVLDRDRLRLLAG